MRFTYFVYYSKKDTDVTKEKREKDKETTGGAICTEPDAEDEFSANTSETVLGETTEKEGTMVSDVKNTNIITSTTSRSSSQESCKTDSFYKSDSNLYLCGFIGSEYNIKATSVLEQMSKKIFFTCAESNEKKEDQQLEEYKQPPAYETDHVPVFDEFGLDVDDDDDN